MNFPEKFKNSRNIILLAIIILFGLLLRLWHLDKPEGMWFDEMTTYLEAKMSFPDIIKTFFTKHIHTPLFYIALHFWINIFGESDLAIRLLPVLFGVLTIPVVYLCGKELNSNKTALTAAFFTAINSLLIYYSQEVRMYSLTALFSALIMLFLLRLNNNPSKTNIAGLALANAGLLYTHSISFIFVFFVFLFFGLYYLFKRKKHLKPLILSGIGTLFLYLPLFYKMFWFVNLKNPGIVAQWWSKFTFSKVWFVLGDFFSPFILAWGDPPDSFTEFVFQSQVFSIIYLILVFLPLIIGLSGIILAVKKKPVNFLLLLICLGFISVFTAASIQGKVVYVSRYIIEIAPIFTFLAIYGLINIENKLISRLLISYLAAISLLVLFLMPVSAPKKGRPLGIKPGTEILNKYNFTKKDYFILVGTRKVLLSKYFEPGKSETFFALHNWNSIFFPSYLKGGYTLKDLTDFGFFNKHGDYDREVKRKRDQFFEQLWKSKHFYTRTNGRFKKSQYYDYFREIIASKSNIFTHTNIDKEIFSHINNTNNLVIITFKGLVIYPDITEIREYAQNDYEAYRKEFLMYMLQSRIAHDLIEYSKKELSLIKKETTDMWDVYIFKKEPGSVN